MSYPFTLFIRPHGEREELTMTRILPEDEALFREHGVKISAEDCNGFFCFWADDGTMMEDDPNTPDEITYIVPAGETCEQSMTKIAQLIRKRKN